MIETTATVRPTYRQLRGLNLGRDFVREARLTPGQEYTIYIEGIQDIGATGTLGKDGFIGGLAILYRRIDLKDGDQVKVTWNNSFLRLTPPDSTEPTLRAATVSPQLRVFERKALKHLHIEPFAPGNLSRWNPQTETDVYMTFGILSEYTDFRYCCGASKSLLDELGFSATTKPDAILIDRTSNAYVIAEFKINSSEFQQNHSKDDIDVLVCWVDDEADKNLLPPVVLSLKAVLEAKVKEGEIDL